MREITTHSPEETIAFGRTLAELLTPPKLVLLRGDLGAGKTTLVKGIAAAFEAAEEDDVTSPTFTLVHEYRGPRATLYHIDLYRIDTQRELETLGLEDLRSENGSILLIEWGEKFPRFVRERDVEISLEREGENGRRVQIFD
jgi:tRNA threonylcarbamoyladenosine biosynthesis protein TsaE